MNENELKAALLMIEESASVLKGHADRMQATANGDYRALTVANLTGDYIKKLAWVHDVVGKAFSELTQLKQQLEEAKEEIGELSKELCRMEDWLLGTRETWGGSPEQLKERIRDLIATEGEAGDLRQQLAAKTEELERVRKAWDVVLDVASEHIDCNPDDGPNCRCCGMCLDEKGKGHKRDCVAAAVLEATATIKQSLIVGESKATPTTEQSSSVQPNKENK